jgi:hypothetical protein
MAERRGDNGMRAHKTVPGLLTKKGGRRCHILLHKRCYLLPLSLSDETGTGFKIKEV